jgi:DNA repair protein RecO (recombination protein O)
LLHTWPHRETSLIIEVLTARHGRLPLLAKGARRATSDLRAVLTLFQPLSLAWSGQGEVRTLVRAHWRDGLLPVPPARFMAGWYVNELLLRHTRREDPEAAVFECYERAIRQLADPTLAVAGVLRFFEWSLLCALGYGFDPSIDQAGEPIRHGRRYRLDPSQGLVESHDGCLEAGSLMALAEANLSALAADRALRQGLREWLDYHGQERPLASRRIMQDLQQS